MSNFDLQIQYPNHADDRDLERYENIEITMLETKFDSISWRKQRVLQLQFDGKNTVFKVTNRDSNEYLIVSLNAFSKSEDFEFKVESNVQLVFLQRELFGLMTRKNKEIFNLKYATLEQAKESLSSFISQDYRALEHIFIRSKNVAVKEVSE